MKPVAESLGPLKFVGRILTNVKSGDRNRREKAFHLNRMLIPGVRTVDTGCLTGSDRVSPSRGPHLNGYEI